MISWNLKNRAVKPIGLDIGYHSIKMIQLTAAKQGGHIIAADKVDIDPDINSDEKQRNEFIVSSIRQMLDKGNFQGRDVITALPNDKLMITNVRLSSEYDSQVYQLLRDEAAKRFGFESKDDVINYMFAGSIQLGENVKNEWILFAAEDDVIRNHIKLLEQAQLQAFSIDAVPCALFRSYRRLVAQNQNKEQTEFFVDIGNCSTTVVFGQGGEICFVKQIPIGGDKFNRKIAKKLGINIKEVERLRETIRNEKLLDSNENPNSAEADLSLKSSVDASTRQVVVDSMNFVAEKLVKEIAMCLRYYIVTFRGKSVSKVILSGGEAYETILQKVLKRQLQIEVEIAQPFEGLDISNVRLDCNGSGNFCEWAVATGLGLKTQKAKACKAC